MIKEIIENDNRIKINEEYLSLSEAASFLKISVSKMQKMSASRLIPLYKPSNGKVYFLKDDLLMYISAGRKSSKEEIEETAISDLIKIGGVYGKN